MARTMLDFKDLGSVQKSPSSPALGEGKATAIFARGAYWHDVSTGKWRERRRRLFSTDPVRKQLFPLNQPGT